MTTTTYYIVAGRDGLIYGYGADVDAAWAHAAEELAAAGVQLVEVVTYDECGNSPPHVQPESHYTVLAASRSLIEQVERNGGNLGWDIVDGVAQVRS